MLIYAGFVAAIVLAGQPGQTKPADNAVPMPALIGDAPLFRKDI